MASYLAQAKQMLSSFKKAEMVQVGRELNSHADALANLASAMEAEKRRTMKVEILDSPSIDIQQGTKVLCIDHELSWMDPIIAYLKHDRLPQNEKEAKKLRLKTSRLWLSPEDKLYKKSFTRLYLQCVHPSKVEDFLYEIHEGICGSHIRGSRLPIEL